MSDKIYFSKTSAKMLAQLIMFKENNMTEFRQNQLLGIGIKDLSEMAAAHFGGEKSIERSVMASMLQIVGSTLIDEHSVATGMSPQAKHVQDSASSPKHVKVENIATSPQTQTTSHQATSPQTQATSHHATSPNQLPIKHQASSPQSAYVDPHALQEENESLRAQVQALKERGAVYYGGSASAMFSPQSGTTTQSAGTPMARATSANSTPIGRSPVKSPTVSPSTNASKKSKKKFKTQTKEEKIARQREELEEREKNAAALKEWTIRKQLGDTLDIQEAHEIKAQEAEELEGQLKTVDLVHPVDINERSNVLSFIADNHRDMDKRVKFERLKIEEASAEKTKDYGNVNKHIKPAEKASSIPTMAQRFLGKKHLILDKREAIIRHASAKDYLTPAQKFARIKHRI